MQRLKDKYNIMASENKSEEKQPKPAAPKPVAKAKKPKPAAGGVMLSKEDLAKLKKLAESQIPTLKGSIQNVQNERAKHAHKEPAIRDRFNEKIDTHIKNYEGHIEFLSKYL